MHSVLLLVILATAVNLVSRNTVLAKTVLYFIMYLQAVVQSSDVCYPDSALTSVTSGDSGSRSRTIKKCEDGPVQVQSNKNANS